MNLLPFPRSLRRAEGHYTLPADATLRLDPSLDRGTVLVPTWRRLREVLAPHGVALELTLATGPRAAVQIDASRHDSAPDHPEGYTMRISPKGILVRYREPGGLRAAGATLRQLVREYGRRLPCLTIRDWPDFPRRGVMLDVSRGKVPTCDTLLEWVEWLADLKVNEFQLYLEHTFAYRDYEPVWRGWGPLTGTDIVRLDARCRELGIDLVPNQNTFGHLRFWLEHPPLRELAETPEPWPDQNGAFLRYPTTLAPTHPRTLPFLRGLMDELLPHFTSDCFNVGCDETWDLGRGQSRERCDRLGQGRVYLDFLLQIHREVTARGRRMMFWGDIILHHPELVRELPRDVIALNWGYEANHPFDREAPVFAQSGVPFYVCPGTSTWMTLIGRHDNAFANLRRAAALGQRHGAIGYLNTEWGDGGHPQPLAVSLLPFALGAALSWNGKAAEDRTLLAVVSRDAFGDPTGRAARAALGLGLTHRRFEYSAPNVTPFGATIAAPPPAWRELVCRDGLKYYSRIPAANIRDAQAELESHRRSLAQAQPAHAAGQMFVRVLDLAARMASQSCHYMLWQQTLASGRKAEARQEARRRIAELRGLEREFNAYWPSRNKGTPARCAAFLGWRIEDYRQGRLKSEG